MYDQQKDPGAQRGNDLADELQISWIRWSDRDCMHCGS